MGSEDNLSCHTSDTAGALKGDAFDDWNCFLAAKVKARFQLELRWEQLH